MTEFQGARIYLNIPVSVAHDERIKSDKSKLIFGEIYSMLNVTGNFYMSNSVLAQRLNCTPRTINNCLTELKTLGYIRTENVKDEKTGAVKGRRISLGIDPMKPISGGVRNEFQGGTEMSFNQREHINKTINKQEREEHQENAYEAFAKTNATLNGFTRPQLLDAIERFGDDVVTFAINRMAEQATYPSFSFLNKKLNDYEDSNVKSVADAEKFEQKRKETNDKRPQRSNAKRKHHSIKATWDKEHERKEKLKQEYLAKYGEVPVNLDTLMDRPKIKPMFKADEEKEMAELGISEDDMPW